MGNVNVYHYTREEFDAAIDRLVHQIKQSGVDYTYIVGLTRGGLIPAVVLSHKLGVPMLASNWATDRKKPSITLMDILDNPRNKVLLVDEILDSGNTIKSFMEMHGNTDVAVLVWNREQPVVPNYYVKSIQRSIFPDWIEFWWEVK